MDDEEEILQLPADTLKLLQEFRDEKDERDKQFQTLKDNAEKNFTDSSVKLSMDLFSEDWNASQFWYTDKTAKTLARQLLHGTDETLGIAIISAPSVYIALRNIILEEEIHPVPRVKLLEYDKRFEVLGTDFVFYDYQHPLQLDPTLKGQFDRIICDPPFLSTDCQTKAALTVKFLASTWDQSISSSSQTTGKDVGGTKSLRFMSCTGERMESVVTKLYSRIDLHTTTFEPKHSKGLSNEFRCYANFECDAWAYRAG